MWLQTERLKRKGTGQVNKLKLVHVVFHPVSVWRKLHLIRLHTHLQRLEDGSAVGGQLGVGSLAEELWEGGDRVQFVRWNLETKTWRQTNLTHTFPSPPPSHSLFLLASSPQRTSHLQTTAATSCRGWPDVCRWLATSPRCRATRRSPLSSPTPARRCQSPCCPGWKKGGEYRCGGSAHVHVQGST